MSLRGYSGAYADAWYGDITFEEAGAVSPATDFSFDFQDLLLKRR